MIIKTTIFVEIERISENSKLPNLVDYLEKRFTTKLRKEDFGKLLTKSYQQTIGIEDFKVITREAALESLRIKK